MNSNRKCSGETELLVWLDGELADNAEENLIAAHTANCPRCQAAIGTLQTENAAFRRMFDDLPGMRDMSKQIMARIEQQAKNLYYLSSLFSCLLVASLSFTLFLAQNSLADYWQPGIWPVSIIKMISPLIDLVVYGGDIPGKFLAGVLLGGPLLPALVIIIPVFIINIYIRNIYNKRRLSNV